MAFNPAAMMKIIGMKSKFDKNHPGVAAFIGNVARKGIKEGSIIEISVTDPDGENMTTNMRVTADDLEMLAELKNMSAN